MTDHITDELISRISAHAAKAVLAHAHEISDKRASEIALAAAKEAVRETHAELFSLLGINIADSKDINRLRGNLEFLSSLHTNTSKAGARVMFAAISMVVGAFGVVVWMGIKALAGK